MKKRDTGEESRIRIREVRLEGNEKKSRQIPPGQRNTDLVIITYVFVMLFALLIGYLAYLTVFRRKELNANVYNTRQESTSDRIIRGPIVTEDGTVLAYSTVDYTGNETRVYPFYSMYAHSVGYATNGRGGLEASANSQLLSSHSPLLEQLEKTRSAQKVQGDSVVVTLRPKLQEAAWYALGDYRGAVVVMEPSSGKILAMVSKPDFDPNELAWEWDSLVEDSERSALLNRATQGLYPPGSTFKILTSLAYLRQNGGDPSSFSWDCTGELPGKDISITCYNGSVHGYEDLKTAFANSCNTAFAGIGLELDNRKFRNTAEDFLFNKPLPVDFPASRSVFALTRESSSDDQMTTAIGQGETLVTPLHMAMITSTVANGGIMMKPYLISSVTDVDGRVVSETRPEIYDELMSLEEASALTECMKETVLSGTGVALSWNGYSVAGKTGSAEYETADGGGTHSWFVGFSDAEDPDIVVAVIAEDGGTGSSTAVPIAQQIFDAWYYG